MTSEKSENASPSENKSEQKKNPFYIIAKKFKDLKTKQKIIIATILVLIIALILVEIFTKYPKNSKLSLSFERENAKAEKMLAINQKAIFGKLNKTEYAFWKFSDEQKQELFNFYKKNESAALKICLELKSIPYEKLIEYSEDEKPLYFGYLFEDDFDKNNRFIGKIEGRVLGAADLRNFLETGKKSSKSIFDFSLALEKNLEEKEIPCGFLVYSSLPVKIANAEIRKAEVGYDLTRNPKFYGLSSNGGTLGNLRDVDFTGASNVFSVSNFQSNIMPKILVQLADNPELEKNEQAEKVYLNAGGEVLTFYRFKDNLNFTLQTSLLLNPFSHFSVSDKNARLSKLLMVQNEKTLVPKNNSLPLEPLVTDPGLIPLSKRNNWRCNDFELYSWEGKENILIFDTKDYDVQNDFFRRIAFFVEKAGFKGRILTDAELAGKHGYNAHDYKAESLADFYNKAEKIPGVLNEKELILKEILLHNEIIIENNGEYLSGKGAIISISQSSANYLRRSLCAHEIWHGLYFTDEDFRNATAAIYYTIDSRAIDFLIAYWTTNPSLNYDSTDDYLIKNEFMAYIMQNPLKNVASYFVHIANFNSSRKNLPELSDYVIATNGIAFEDAANAFDSYVHDRWGLNCGRVSMVTR